MANISFRDFLLSQTVVTGKRNPNVTVDGAKLRYKIDATTRRATEELDGTIVDIVARGKTQSVKLPIETKPTVDKIIDALKQQKVVTINFGNPSTLRGKCYAMMNNGQLLSGVSCTATELNIVSIEEPDFEDFDDIIID